jgi:hypothetical protein
MKPSDTHIDRMAETFAERTPYLRKTRGEAKTAWKDALEISRADDTMTQIESHMKTRGTVDKVAQDAWDTAREY